MIEDTTITSKKDLSSIHFAQPRWCRVRELCLVRDDIGRTFMPCSCNRRTTLGLPCGHFFKIARDSQVPLEDVMDISMFDVRWLKLFNSKYGEHIDGKTTDISNLLYEAQEECFQSEGKGVHISKGTYFCEICTIFFLNEYSIIRNILSFVVLSYFFQDYESYISVEFGEEQIYPILSEGTTEDDYREAMWVLDRQKKGKSTSWIDLVMYTSEIEPSDAGLDDYDDPDEIPLAALTTGMKEYTSVSESNKHIQKAIERSSSKNKEESTQKSVRTYSLREEIVKYVYDGFKSFNEDAKCSDERMKMIKSDIEMVYRKHRLEINKELVSMEEEKENWNGMDRKVEKTVR